MTAFRDELSAPEFRGKVVIHHDGGDPAKALDLWPIAGGAQEPRAPLLLRSARADAGGARHDRPLVVDRDPFRGLQRRRRATARRHAVQRQARAIQRRDRSRCRSAPPSSKRCAPQGHDVPSSCESGTCGTCRTKLLAGEADHRDLVLTESERGSQIMICVSRAQAPRTRDRSVSSSMADRSIRLGVAGLGRAFTLMLPTFAADPRVDACRRRRSAPGSARAVRGGFRRADLRHDRGAVRRSRRSRRSMSRRRTRCTPRMSQPPPRTASMCWSKSRWRSRSTNAAR